MLRHGQQTVRMALAAALHHSDGPKEKVEIQQNGAPRGQKTAARAGEEVDPREQETPPPGARPGILAEPQPQRSDRSRRHFSGDCLPTLGLPVVAGALGEQVDYSTLRFLTAAALKAKRKLEEEEKTKMKKLKEEMEAAEHEEKMLELNRRVQADFPLSAAERSAWRQWIGIAPAASSSSSAGKRRKRKKRRKRRTPRTSSCPRGRARRPQRRWLLHGCSVFPSVDELRIMAGLDQKDSLPRDRCCACCRHWQWLMPGWFC